MQKNREDKRERQLGVLLIEDEPDLCELLQMRFRQERFLVVTARDGARALKLLTFVVPDVIVTDLMMPVLDGFELIQRYRLQVAAPAPIVAISALEANANKALELGAEAAFVKPLELGRMIETIRTLATHQRQRARAAGTPQLRSPR
jgi:DNA-binding response OmpR family regulator